MNSGIQKREKIYQIIISSSTLDYSVYHSEYVLYYVKFQIFIFEILSKNNWLHMYSKS